MSMVERHMAVAAAFLLVLSVTPASSQTVDVAKVFFDAVPFATETGGATRLDLFAVVPYSAIPFERSDARFSARYRLRLSVTTGGETAFDTTFDRTATTASADEAGGQSPVFDYFQIPVELQPGSYEARLEFTSGGAGLEGARKRSVTLVDYGRHPFALSGTLLVSQIREDSIGHVITPLLSENIGSADGYFLFFEAYNRGRARDVVYSVAHRAASGRDGVSQTFTRHVDSGRTQQWLRLRPEGLPRGTYVVELRALDAADTSRVLAATERTVNVEGSDLGLPIGEAELDERISQLRYVAMQSEIDEIRERESFRDRRAGFAEFWQRRDPTPGTAENEAMLQYYSRVDYANEHLRSYAAGWLTDQGRIYIIFGPPDNISRQPFRTDGRSIETWQYYSRNLELRFEDQSGFGDFRLLTPVSNLEKYKYQG